MTSFRRRRLAALVFAVSSVFAACGRPASPPAESAPPDEPTLPFKNVASGTAYVGDSTCAGCHRAVSTAYQANGMSQSFHPWRAGVAGEAPMDSAIRHERTGYEYTVARDSGRLFQVEFLRGPDGTRIHELKRRIDRVMGSGNVGRTYFTEENGRLYQLPLTLYKSHGWDFSPGYDKDNGRFDRLLPDRCLSCHAGYPEPKPFLEGKYAQLRDGIGCERCHGPGALHVTTQAAAAKAGRPATVAAPDTAVDLTIVNPRRLPLERRLDVCGQCHVHTALGVLREGKNAFSFMPSQPLHVAWAYFKRAGSVDIVSHADRLRGSRCFLASRASAKPLECATCHNPHDGAAKAATRNASCASCHATATLAVRMPSPDAKARHAPGSDCVQCHMPRVAQQDVHGAFTDHRIRVVSRDARTADAPVAARLGLEPYFAADRGTSRDARVYTAMGAVLAATLGRDPRGVGLAADSLAAAIDGDASRADASFMLGAAYAQVGRHPDAIRALERSLTRTPDRPEAMRALAQSYLLSRQRPDAVDSLYRRALTLQPALAWVRTEYAELLAARGRFDDAEREYLAAIAEEPSRATAHVGLGILFMRRHRLLDARIPFATAVHLDPAFAEALAPVYTLRRTGNEVAEVGEMATTVTALPRRARPEGTFDIVRADRHHLAFMSVAPKGFVLIFRPDGMLLGALPTGDGGALRWDLQIAPGQLLGSGLYRAELRGPTSDGKPLPPQSRWFLLVEPVGPET